MKITKDTKLSEIVEHKPDAAKVLADVGMGCAGCPCAQQETLEQGCLAHGMTEKDVEEIVRMLNTK